MGHTKVSPGLLKQLRSAAWRRWRSFHQAKGRYSKRCENNHTTSVAGFADLSLPEVTALAARARLFIGNDSGIAHIAAATGTPSVVIFGSSNVTHWRPWTVGPSEVVREELACQPCHGYFCAEFDQPQCILRVPVERVVGAIDRILRSSEFN